MFKHRFLVLLVLSGLAALICACSPLEAQTSYQGQLTDSAGNPVSDGNYQMTFRLYSAQNAAVDAAVWSESQSVPVTDGLFNVTLGASDTITTSLFAQKLWLGVEVESDGEMTPRQKLTGAPYAMSLVPGAFVQGTINKDDPLPGSLNIYNAGNGYGVGVAALGEAGIAVDGGDVGQTGLLIDNFTHGGVITSTVLGLKVTVSDAAGDDGIVGRTESTGGSAWGIKGEAGSDVTGGVLGRATGTGVFAVRGSNADGIGGYFWNGTTSYYSLRAYNTQGDTAPGLYVRGTSTFTGAKTGYVAELCQNAGPEILETGDVVVIVGYSDAVLGEIPVVQVRMASEANATGVIGIVDVRQVVNPTSEDLLNDPEVTTSPEAEVHVAEGPIQPGDYLLVVTLGAYKGIKVDASLGPIRPGDLLTASSNGGYAMKGTPLKIDGATFYAPGTIIGKALGSLDKGTGIIPVFVSAR